MSTVTILDGERHTTVAAVRRDDAVCVDAADLEDATGWHLEPRGLCRGDVCVPVRDRDALVRADGVDLATFAAVLGRPVVVDAAAGVVAFGEAAGGIAEQLRSLHAPDFTLPTLSGEPLRFSSLGRKKKLLLAWASW